MKKVVLFISILALISLSIYTFYIDNSLENIAENKNLEAYAEKLTAPRLLYWGTRGDDVREVQRRLRNWGYYDGAVDGIYGPRTYSAVREFQRKNGLAVDGVVGPQTAAALGIYLGPTQGTTSRGVSRNDNVYLLARAVHGEARGEPYIGKVAVAAVILNRVEHPKFPNTIASVIYQPGAFTAVSDGQINLAPDDESLKAARDALNGWDPSYGSLYYWNPATSTSRWIWSRNVIIKIGKHWFGI
ncbi:spore cortex-lytic enzyme [Caldisalinibacter kiritimatiensis]|uniref:Spore cortex-lytic enzyme n=1 Tax=Caldisalinibacter kiritimatiensis TaxID=1304284 RepID=R1AYB5_9FIRM|nr:spore cortex-lytic enzyme [Caldisalinibacter kiritimatiensis]EOD01682.1 Spore cortex-lytic enzyme, lytic transglycosylase SleB [Caldisalinibacter kiritimatiensis]